MRILQQRMWLHALGVVLAIATVVTPVRADDASEAQLQFELGTAYFEQRRYPEAIERFLASYRLVENARVGANIVRTYEVQSGFADAYNWCDTLERRFPDASDVLAFVRARKAALEPRLAVLLVATQPASAELFITRQNLGSVGRSPRRIALSAQQTPDWPAGTTSGRVRVIATLAGFRDAEREVDAAVGQVTPVELQLVARVGTLRIASEPAGATVRERGGGAVLGTTPLTLERPVGELALELSLDRHVTVERTATIVDGQSSDLLVTLERRFDRVAVFSVRGSPANARVSVAGNTLARSTPLSRDDLPPGRAVLVITAPNRLPWSTTLTLEAGAATRVEYRLADPEDASWDGWLWLGYGVGGALLGTGTSLGIVAVSERESFLEVASRRQLDRVDALNLSADVLIFTGVGMLAATLLYHLLRPGAPASEGRVRVER